MTRMVESSLTQACKRVLVVAGALALASCQTVQTTQPGAVGVDRKQVMMLSPAEVDKASAQAYQQTMQQATKKGTLNRNPAQVARVRAIAQRLIPATASFRGCA